jgi:tRNA A-37 threonylcarbamoyl transferase component Bud32
MLIEGQQHALRKILKSKLSALEGKTWTKELDMYPDLIGAIKDGLYKETEDILVVDTSQRNDFHADVSVAAYDDARLPYCVRYFLEFKLPSVEPRTAAHCGQMLDYFKSIREKQPHRSRFIGVLSNYSSSWVYDAVFDENGPKIEEYPCSSLADAIIFADKSLASQLRATIPSLDKALDPKFSVLSVGKHYFLLSVKKRIPLQDDTVPRHMPTRSQTVNIPKWFPPVRYREQKSQFVLKITHDNHSLDNEITILEKLRDANCLHIPDLVWIRGSGELGILPIGEPVLPGEPAAVSRKIVRGMIDGLRYLHSQGIVHRDIRLSNLILKRERNDINVVIIDYETAFDSRQNHSTGSEVDYSGGYICWPQRLLQSTEQLYMPEPADDLFACILVVLHLLFPRRFDELNVGNIRADGSSNPETLKVLQMWKDIENSKIWGGFYRAAKDEDYDKLLEISEVFCHV